MAGSLPGPQDDTHHMTISNEELSRAEAIAQVQSGGARLVLERLETLPAQVTGTAEWRHVRALAHAYLGTTGRAVVVWEELLDEGLWSEQLVAELARAYLTLDRAADAEALLQAWRAGSGCALSADLEVVWAESLLAQRDSDKARELLRRVDTRRLRATPAGRTALLRARVLCGDWSTLAADVEARSSGAGLLGIVGLLQRNGALYESAVILEHLVAVAGDDLDVWTRLARVKWQMGEENAAMNLLADAHEKFPGAPALLEAIARTCIDDRSYELAGAWITRLEEELGSQDSRVRGLAAEVMLGLGDLQAVRELIDAADEDEGDLDPARVAFYSRINVPDRALAYQDRQVQRDPCAETLLARARLAAAAGRSDEAVESARQVFASTPGSLGASALLVAHGGPQAELRHLQRLRDALHRGNLALRQRAWLYHCLAEYHHGTGDHAIAAEMYQRCNALSEPPEEERYDARRHARWLDELDAAFDAAVPVEDAALSAARRDSRHPQAGPPVFIVGVPRSGTTLTEQILARHPRVTGMGECQHASLSLGWLRQPQHPAPGPLPLQEALARATPATLRGLRERLLDLLAPHAGPGGLPAGHLFIDKMPDNYSLVGWIFTLFPEAKIVYARRDPREIALSCWKANFGAINWAYRMEDIAERIIAHHRIMQHWLALYGERIFISDYADLVNDPQAQTRRLLAYLGLDWDPACGDHTRATSVVRTASVNQVRRPVYRTSLEKWRAYEQVLEPAVERLRAHGLVCG
ncbi:MAG: hypothetical protein CME59_08935 [Halioglobus sp.]|nr:hypothetical protein [Halioglobus sp.]